MTKSNVRAVRRRRTNQRIARQYDPIQQQRVRNYQQHQRVRNPERKTMRQAVSEKIRRVVQNFRRWVRRFTSQSNNIVIRALDLRDGGLYANKPKRDAGAQQLRSWFSMGLKMVSTRDGKTV